jgi:hypothetical protein
LLGLVVSIGAVGLLVWRGMKRSLAPAESDVGERKRLASLKAKRRWKLDEAEDGLVLARRYNDAAAAKKFSVAVAELRKRRVKI